MRTEKLRVGSWFLKRAWLRANMVRKRRGQMRKYFRLGVHFCRVHRPGVVDARRISDEFAWANGPISPTGSKCAARKPAAYRAPADGGDLFGELPSLKELAARDYAAEKYGHVSGAEFDARRLPNESA